MTQLSVITATWNRPERLALCLAQFRGQSRGSLQAEHLVVSDGPDRRAAALANRFGARYCERPTTGGAFGAWAKDTGIAQANGEYVCFWDDDNQIEPHALSTLYAAAFEHDIGIVQIQHLNRDTGELRILPEIWTGDVLLGAIDTLCLCVRRELALSEPWSAAPEPRNTDYHWLKRLARHTSRIRFVPVVVGVHL